MPEGAIDEDRDFRSPKNNIRLTGQIRAMATPTSGSECEERTPKSEFRGRVAALNLSHDTGSNFRRIGVGHVLETILSRLLAGLLRGVRRSQLAYAAGRKPFKSPCLNH